MLRIRPIGSTFSSMNEMKIKYTMSRDSVIEAHGDFLAGLKEISKLKKYLLVVAYILWFLIAWNEHLGLSFSFSSGDRSFSTENILILRVINALAMSILFGWLTVKLLRELSWGHLKGRFKVIPLEAYGVNDAIFEEEEIVLNSPLSSQSLSWKLVTGCIVTDRYFHLKHVTGPRIASIPKEAIRTSAELEALWEMLNRKTTVTQVTRGNQSEAAAST